MEGDLLTSLALASILRTQTAKNETPTQQVQGVQVGITSDQIAQLSVSIGQAVRGAIEGIQLPDINVPPAQVQFPENIQANISDEQIARITSAISTPTPLVFDILNRSVQTDITGAGIHALGAGSYPSIVKLVEIEFIQDVRVVGLVLSVSLLNTGTEPMGLFACRGQGGTINLTPSADPTIRANDIYLSIVTHNNSTVGTNAPASRTASIGFSPSTSAVIIKAGASIAIYGCSQNTASALLTGVLSVYYTTES